MRKGSATKRIALPEAVRAAALPSCTTLIRWKTKTGTLESRAGWKGLCRKGVSLLVVLVACRLDAIIGSSFIRDATVIAFACNETISIIENAGLMGVPIPAALTKAVDVLRQRAEKAEKE